MINQFSDWYANGKYSWYKDKKNSNGFLHLYQFMYTNKPMWIFLFSIETANIQYAYEIIYKNKLYELQEVDQAKFDMDNLLIKLEKISPFL